MTAAAASWDTASSWSAAGGSLRALAAGGFPVGEADIYLGEVDYPRTRDSYAHRYFRIPPLLDSPASPQFHFHTFHVMDSINAQQPEKNHEDLNGPDAVKRIRDTVKKAETCFFCTGSPHSGSDGIRPMNVRQVDDNGTLWFLSSVDSHKNEELERDATVVLLFQGGPHSDFLHLIGTARISRDKAKIKELWEPVLKTWFTEGIDDPRITAIQVVPSRGYYWDNKHGNLVAGVKMLIGAATGKTLDDSIEGRVRI